MLTLTRTLTIINKRGLHARAAAKFASTSALYKSVIKTRVGTSNNWVDGKSVMSLMLLAASQGTTLEIQVDGEDAEHALEALCQLIEKRFEEDE
jgi:phosphocarrier protein HPr